MQILEQGEVDKVIDLFEQFPELIQSTILNTNNWTPAMYACRYGRKDLLQYLIKNNCLIQGPSPYTPIHAACFGNEKEILKMLLDEMHWNPTPLTYETTPLKYCVKSDNIPLIELLISRGAYFIYGEFLNNITSVETVNDQVVYKSKYFNRKTSKIEEVEINQNFVFKVHEIREDSPAKKFIKWFRCRNWLFICYLKYNKEKNYLQSDKASAFGYLALNKNFSLMKQFLIGPSSSSTSGNSEN